MLRAPSLVRRTGVLAFTAVVLSLSLAPSAALAVVIDLSLNVFYASPTDPNSGGAWSLVAKSDGQGIASVSARLTGITTAQNAGPRGTVNGNDPAGFSIFANTPDPMGFNNVTIGQAPISPTAIGPGEEQSVFYGVGTLANGTPGMAGPAFTSLTNLEGSPWATGDMLMDPAWNTAATLAFGMFAPGNTPGFFSGGEDFRSTGNTFTSLGTSMTAGNISTPFIVATTIVRTNLAMPTADADYNDNGVVDAADYVVWRATLGSTTMLAADGNNNGMIDDGDYDLWRQNFGFVIAPGSGAGAGSSASAAVPEPTTLALATIIGATMTFLRARGRAPSRGRKQLH